MDQEIDDREIHDYERSFNGKNGNYSGCGTGH